MPTEKPGKTLDVAQVTWGRGTFFPGLQAQTVTVQRIDFSGSPYLDQVPSVTKLLHWVNGDRLTFRGDVAGKLDSQCYPTALEKNAAAVKDKPKTE